MARSLEPLTVSHLTILHTAVSRLETSNKVPGTLRRTLGRQVGV